MGKRVFTPTPLGARPRDEGCLPSHIWHRTLYVAAWLRRDSVCCSTLSLGGRGVPVVGRSRQHCALWLLMEAEAWNRAPSSPRWQSMPQYNSFRRASQFRANALHVVGCVPMIPGAFEAKAILGLFAISEQHPATNDMFVAAMDNALSVMITGGPLVQGCCCPKLSIACPR